MTVAQFIPEDLIQRVRDGRLTVADAIRTVRTAPGAN